MTIRKILKHVAISALLRYETVKWTAFAILVALGVVKESSELQLEAENGTLYVSMTGWLRWLSRVDGDCDEENVVAIKCRLGMKLLVRGP